jgi:hypothetical protein
MTYKEVAQTALDVQDACNLSGVVKSFAGPVMDALWEETRRNNTGTDWINQHPIVTLFIDKLASLNGTQGFDSMSKVMAAYDAVRTIAEGPDA